MYAMKTCAGFANKTSLFFRLQSICRVYESINLEAASLIQLFYGSDMPPYDIQERLGEWIERWENLKDIRKGSREISDVKIENDLVRKLKKEIDKVWFVFVQNSNTSWLCQYYCSTASKNEKD